MHFKQITIVLTSCISLINCAVHFERIYGVAEEDLGKYQRTPDDLFHCLDGNGVIPYSALNDDYCDCADGSDEPGTAACPGTKFYCDNHGSVGHFIPSSRVNDGVCDYDLCCDGSDEYNGGIECPDRCEELEKLKESTRKEEIMKIYNAFQKRQEMIAQSLKNVTEDTVTLIENQELYNKENEELDKIKAEIKELEEIEKRSKDFYKLMYRDLKKDYKEYIKKFKKAIEDMLVIKSMEGNDKIDSNVLHDIVKDYNEEILEELNKPKIVPKKEQEEEEEEEESIEIIEEEREEEEEVNEEISTKQIPNDESFEFKPISPKNIPSSPPPKDIPSSPPPKKVNPLPPKDIPSNVPSSSPELNNSDDEEEDEEERLMYEEKKEAHNKIKDQLIALRSKRSTIDRTARDYKRTIDKIEKKLSIDSGLNKIYYSIYEKVYSLKTSDYTYTLTWGKEIKQKEEHGPLTLLGKFKEFRDNYRTVIYDDGAQCWNGPKRSVTVNLICKEQNEILKVSEPSKCEYVMDFGTPGVCDNSDIIALKKPEDTKSKEINPEFSEDMLESIREILKDSPTQAILDEDEVETLEAENNNSEQNKKHDEL
ncbi:hypothetical protein BCR32DRAFT_271285 [Anaeromyces robustus]|jgi:protein kinase C substrate 80K-H|uniref:Glucosidase 2 subunit beta n=1 Tax=Anaeromyces robustus TaxID=1754192 RepID=A0A1Y1WS83_9FUNG|nr:hypothetical protein BCR32DRAFT_271285 [Anaeromyces robustus]|eukprot:ORX76401.1 hypothetical protein BCR32DRAFT_271285 [Anaeromyces robustus]